MSKTLPSALKLSRFGNKLKSDPTKSLLSRDRRLHLLLHNYKDSIKDPTPNPMLFKNKRVLDIGCHKGDLAIELASYH
jgi:2-polyprenyl-3-methyl-5-hydroxy-6-metoxy-1,4-benzoquinol methylase